MDRYGILTDRYGGVNGHFYNPLFLVGPKKTVKTKSLQNLKKSVVFFHKVLAIPLVHISRIENEFSPEGPNLEILSQKKCIYILGG